MCPSPYGESDERGGPVRKNILRSVGGRVRMALGAGLLLPGALWAAGSLPGEGIRLGAVRVSPFLEGSIGYDSNARLAEGDVLTLQPDGSYELQNSRIDDYFTQWTVGAGVSRVLESEWDLRFRGWYQSRWYEKQTYINYDSFALEQSGRYWPASDRYALSMGVKYRAAEDVERVPVSAATTMPGETPLPYLGEREDRLQRVTVDGFASFDFRPGERTSMGTSISASTVNYEDRRLFDYWSWTLNANAGYQYTDRTAVFLEGDYQILEGDALLRAVPVYALRAGLRTKSRVKLDYRISVGAKTYEHATDSTGGTWKQTWDLDFDGLMNWRYSEKLSFFGKAWTDVGTTVQYQAPEDTRRTYAAQLGTDYAFLRRLNAVGAISYRLDSYDFTIHYDNGLTQSRTELWQVMGRLTLSPQVNTFWKVYVESSYEVGANDLDNYDQWLVWLGLSAWY